MRADLNDLAVFNQVVAENSFSGAARKLGLPPSAVSRRVARLEERLGHKLLHRTTRKLGLTEAGRIYYGQTARISSAAEEGERALEEMSAEPRGLVRVTTPPDDGNIMWPAFSSFLERYPEVELDLIQTTRFVDLVEEAVDIAVRGGEPPDSTLISARYLVDNRRLLVASPEYLERRGVPQTLEDLSEHECIVTGAMAPRGTWALAGPDGARVRVPVAGRLRVDHLQTALRAALDCYGITMMIDAICARELAEGKVVEVLPGVLGPPQRIYALSAVRRHRSPAVGALLDHLVDELPRRLAGRMTS